MADDLDKLDLRIIETMQENATRSSAGIARELGTGEETVRRRLKRLIDEGYIQVVALPDPTKLGYTSEVLIGIQARPEMVDSVGEVLAGLNEVNWVCITTGSFDIFVWATLRSPEELSEFLRKKVGKISGVYEMEAFINFEMRKRDYRLRI